MFIMDSRFHGNDINVIVVIPAEAGIHPMQKSFPRYLSKSYKSFRIRNLATDEHGFSRIEEKIQDSGY